jgi:uncharacterized membrane protein YphA (DoxX/SURF4 family)
MVNVILWIVQALLAIFFLGAGAPKILGRGLERWTGFNDLPRPLVIFIGVTEILGAIGLVLPMATGILPWLTPLSALGLAITVLMASGFHIRNDERLEAIETSLWASILTIIAIARWDSLSAIGSVAPWTLVALLAVLVPATIVNIIAIMRRPIRTP